MTIELANRLAELRKQKGLSQEELADKLQVSRQAVSKWERGEASPDTDNLIELAKIYEISLDELVGLDVPNKSNNNDYKNKKGIHITDEGEGFYITSDGIHIHDDEGNEVEAREHEVRITDKNGNTKIINHMSKYHKLMALISSIVTLIIVIVYLLLGSLLGLWGQAWPLFLLVVVIPSIFEAALQKKPYKFNYAVFVVFVYFLLNSWILYEAPLWHPLWVMFITIPVYYAITGFIKHRNDEDDEDGKIVSEEDED